MRSPMARTNRDPAGEVWMHVARSHLALLRDALCKRGLGRGKQIGENSSRRASYRASTRLVPAATCLSIHHAALISGERGSILTHGQERVRTCRRCRRHRRRLDDERARQRTPSDARQCSGGRALALLAAARPLSASPLGAVGWSAHASANATRSPAPTFNAELPTRVWPLHVRAMVPPRERVAPKVRPHRRPTIVRDEGTFIARVIAITM